MHDVIIVGAGSAGNIAALRLSQMGHDVAVFDMRHDLGDKLCTGIVGRECFDRFKPDAGMVLHKAKSVRVFSPTGSSYLINRKNPEAYVIDRVAFVSSLASLAEESGATFNRGYRVTSVRTTDKIVEISTLSDGVRSKHQGKVLIVANGFGSSILKMVGLSPDKSLAYLIGTQCKVEAEGLEQTEVYVGSSIAPGAFGWVVPISQSLGLAGMASPDNTNLHMPAFLDRLRKTGKINSIVEEPTSWGIPIESLPKTYKDRVIVAGDAAGLAKPTTGGGIYYSLLSGEIAASVIGDAIIDDDLSAGRLVCYQNQWQKVFSDELKLGRATRQVFECLDDRQLERLLETLCSTEISREVISSEAFAFDWHSKLILKAVGHKGLISFLRSFGPVVTPFLSKIVRSVER